MRVHSSRYIVVTFGWALLSIVQCVEGATQIDTAQVTSLSLPKSAPGSALLNANIKELRAIIEDVTGATGFSYGTRDSAGNTMDTAKIIADPTGGYFAIYHHYNGVAFEVHLAKSTDLLNWTYLQSYGANTAQPYLTMDENGGFLLVDELDTRPYVDLHLRYYNSRDDLLANKPSRTLAIPHTLVPAFQLAEGTPNIYSIKLNPDIDHSTIELGFHYWKDGDTDRVARGTLVDFSLWSSQPDTSTNNAILSFGALGNIGDRDNMNFRGDSVNIQEGQFSKNDFGSWRVFLLFHTAASISAIELYIRTHGGSQAFCNSTFTLVQAPGGGQALVVTHFIPSENSALGEAGELIYYKVLRD